MAFIPDYPIFAVSKDVLTSSEKLVLLAIKFHIGTHPDSYVPQDTLAVETSLCRNTVINATKELRAKGWIKVKKRRNCSNIYSLVADKFKMPPSTKSAKVESLGIPKHNECADDSPKAQSGDKAKHNDCAAESTPNMHKVINTKNTDQDIKSKSKDSAAIAAQNESQNLHDSVGDKKSINKENGVKELEALWRDNLPKHFPNDSAIPKFSPMNYKMLKEFSTLVSPHHATDVLLCTIENWYDFIVYAKEQYGAFPIPAIPTLDFILKQKNIPAAVNYYVKQSKSVTEEFSGYKHYSDGYSESLPEDGISIKPLEDAWREVMQSIDPDFAPDTEFCADIEFDYQIVKDFTQKLKKPTDILKTCLLQWESYCKYLEDQFSKDSLPEYPTPEVVIFFRKESVQYYKSVMQQGQVTNESPTQPVTV